MKTIFISMIGLEERVIGAFSHTNIEADDYLLFINKEFENEGIIIKSKAHILKKYLDGRNYRILNSSYLRPFDIIIEINKLKQTAGIDFKKVKVILDISTFNRQNLLIVLHMLRKNLQVPYIELIYTIPVTQNDTPSKGVIGFANIPFFGGKFSIDKKKLLVLLIGYEIERPLHLWRELEPSLTILTEGFEPTDKKFYQRNNDVVKELQGMGLGPSQIVQIPANDPIEARDGLEKIFNERTQEYNIIASPLNTKLQTVGLYLAWEKYPQLQIQIAYPNYFNNSLSEGIKEVKRFSI